MKKILAFFLLLMVAVPLFGCQRREEKTSSDPSWQEVQQDKKLVVGVDISKFPMAFSEQEGAYSGFDADLAREVCRRLDLNIEFQNVSVDNVQGLLDDGIIDCVWSNFISTPERDEAFTLSSSYFTVRHVLLVPEASECEELADFAEKQLGVISASTSLASLERTEMFRGALAGTTEYGTPQEALEGLLAGEVDGLLLDETVARYFILYQGGLRLILGEDGSPESLGEDSLVIGFPRGDEALKAKVEEALATMNRDQIFTEYSKKWFGEDISLSNE